jgi:hypothetical protein
MTDKLPDVNVELFALSYGSLVRAIVKETNNVEDANAKLAKIGVSIGNRMTDDIVVYLKGNCNFKNLRELCDKLIVDSFKKYLGIAAQVATCNETVATIRLLDNPVTRYVTIPHEYEGLVYLQPLVSAIKTICSMMHYNTDVRILNDTLKGAVNTDIEIKWNGISRDTLPPGEWRD